LDLFRGSFRQNHVP